MIDYKKVVQAWVKGSYGKGSAKSVASLNEKNKGLTLFFQPIKFVDYQPKKLVITESLGERFAWLFGGVNSYGKEYYENGRVTLFLSQGGKISFGISSEIALEHLRWLRAVEKDLPRW